MLSWVFLGSQVFFVNDSLRCLVFARMIFCSIYCVTYSLHFLDWKFVYSELLSLKAFSKVKLDWITKIKEQEDKKITVANYILLISTMNLGITFSVE